MAKGKGSGKRGLVRISTFIRSDQLEQMRAVQAEHGIPVAEQIRRVLDHVVLEEVLGIKYSSRRLGRS